MVNDLVTLFCEYTKVRAIRGNERYNPASFLLYLSFGVTANGADLVYRSRLREANDVEDAPRRALFRGTLGTINVVVKFCETSCVEVHRLLADHGFAPTLHYFGSISGGLYMIMMDYVPGSNAHHFREDPATPLPNQSLEDIKDAVTLLHEHGFVFGDLRRPNIMVVKRRTATEDQGTIRGMLVDFGWAGRDRREGEARYSPKFNTSLTWVDGVRGGALITKRARATLDAKIIVVRNGLEVLGALSFAQFRSETPIRGFVRTDLTISLFWLLAVEIIYPHTTLHYPSIVHCIAKGTKLAFANLFKTLRERTK
jgi:serine/threonine protein kinase